MAEASLAGLTVLAFESRRANEIAELIRRRGGTAIVAPALREVALTDSQPALAFVDQLERRAIDVVIFLTGVGTRALADVARERASPQRFAELLGRCRLIARGPKPLAALRELGLTPTLTVPEPNTWREILAAIDREVPVAGLRVAVQEYGATNPELLAGLTARGAEVVAVPVYRWALPDDLAPLRGAIAALLGSEVDVVLFTSATQVDHLFRVARQDGIESVRLQHAFARVLIGSIGPICTEALRRHGLTIDLEPEHGKMGHLVAAVGHRGRAALEAKRVA